jgi:hypothetical protein
LSNNKHTLSQQSALIVQNTTQNKAGTIRRTTSRHHPTHYKAVTIDAPQKCTQLLPAYASAFHLQG